MGLYRDASFMGEEEERKGDKKGKDKSCTLQGASLSDHLIKLHQIKSQAQRPRAEV